MSAICRVRLTAGPTDSQKSPSPANRVKTNITETSYCFRVNSWIRLVVSMRLHGLCNSPISVARLRRERRSDEDVKGARVFVDLDLTTGRFHPVA